MSDKAIMCSCLDLASKAKGHERHCQIYTERIEAENAALQARIAELEKDRERLAWLVRNGYTLLELEIDDNSNPLWGLLDPGSEGLNGWDVKPRHEDWNDAIDAAMRKGGKG